MGKSDGTQTQTNAPWEPASAPMQNQMAAAQGWFFGPQAAAASAQRTRPDGSSPEQYLPGYDGGPGGQGGVADPTAWMNQQMVAGSNPDVQRALAMTRGRAMGGSNLNRMAQMQAMNTMAGGGMAGAFRNQFDIPAAAMARQFQEGTMPALASQFGRGGRTGSGIHQQMAGRATEAFGGSLAGLASQVYGGERQRQMQAMGMAPGLAQQDYADISQLMRAGEYQRGIEQQQIDAPGQRLQQMAGILGTYGGQGGTQSQPTSGSPLAQAAGLGLMGYGAMGTSAAAPYVGGGLALASLAGL